MIFGFNYFYLILINCSCVANKTTRLHCQLPLLIFVILFFSEEKSFSNNKDGHCGPSASLT